MSGANLSWTVGENPLIGGAIALIAGAIIGSLVPRTEMEDNYLGDARDTIVDNAKQMAESAVGPGSTSQSTQKSGRSNAPSV